MEHLENALSTVCVRQATLDSMMSQIIKILSHNWCNEVVIVFVGFTFMVTRMALVHTIYTIYYLRVTFLGHKTATSHNKSSGLSQCFLTSGNLI